MGSRKEEEEEEAAQQKAEEAAHDGVDHVHPEEPHASAAPLISSKLRIIINKAAFGLTIPCPVNYVSDKL